MIKTLFQKQWHRFDSLILFNKVIDLLFKLLIFFVVLVLAMGLVKMFLEVWTIMTASELKEAFGFIVTNLLTFFIILELFKSLVDYFREHRLKLTFIVDATLVFLLREVMIGLYQHQSSPLQICALAFLALVLGSCAHSRSFTRPWNEGWWKVCAERKSQPLRAHEMTREPAVAPPR